MELLPFLGIACVVWSLLEITTARGEPRLRSATFGAVDADTGRPIELVCDRRRSGPSRVRYERRAASRTQA